MVFVIGLSPVHFFFFVIQIGHVALGRSAFPHSKQAALFYVLLHPDRRCSKSPFELIHPAFANTGFLFFEHFLSFPFLLRIRFRFLKSRFPNPPRPAPRSFFQSFKGPRKFTLLLAQIIAFVGNFICPNFRLALQFFVIPRPVVISKIPPRPLSAP